MTTFPSEKTSSHEVGAPRLASQYDVLWLEYDVLRPQHKQPERQIALRDRYHVTYILQPQ